MVFEIIVAVVLYPGIVLAKGYPWSFQIIGTAALWHSQLSLQYLWLEQLVINWNSA